MLVYKEVWSMDIVDLSTVDWARAQFALTAMFHWLFVPLTLGLSFLCAFMETIYVRTGDEKWRRITQFWMTLFGINFAIGVSTGIILEFEFGTNWSNYSWMVGDIFGAPLAVEGIVAFFLEATFFAVMFFGWERVSKPFHLFSTWMVAVGSNLSALWILVANGWMQSPVGMHFNLDTARFEMVNFWEVLFSPVAISKFTHTTSTSFIVASCFVLAVSSYYLLRRRHIEMARKSILVASVFGLLSGAMAGLTGDHSAVSTVDTQPMKLAAYEGLYKGETNAGIVVFGLLNQDKVPGDEQDPYYFQVKIPFLLSLLAKFDINAFIPGIDDLIFGNKEHGILGVEGKMARGKVAVASLQEYKRAMRAEDKEAAEAALATFTSNSEYLGYGYLESPLDAVPPMGLTFYSYRVMVFLALFFLLLFAGFLYYGMKDRLLERAWVLRIGVLSFFLATTLDNSRYASRGQGGDQHFCG
ncbi:unnamed protein product [Cyprideis torosa]|uniref:Uncharacterized protein n=1 Tax=Cyprideis torosa TaxID=163714 RepID=A0A7R8WJM8_9CRUS|nr:unnamed protein product [Cyprideis torosa]CAG0902187.1 unnamed protein product [Cyprideis torosa]